MLRSARRARRARRIAELRAPELALVRTIVVRAGSVAYASNAGSGTLSDVGLGVGGQLTSLGTTETSAGTVDAAVAANGRFLYVQGGAAGTVDTFQVGVQGALTKVGTVTVPGAVGGEGIVAL